MKNNDGMHIETASDPYLHGGDPRERAELQEMSFSSGIIVNKTFDVRSLDPYDLAYVMIDIL
ncbi:59_t:CDS:2 [Funneliformis geosporum]|nr:59_t:CDS:2 [Funneliformis geosporum]